MRILLVDRDQVTNELVGTKLSQLGHAVTTENVKNDAIERIKKESFDVVMIDPSPMREAQALALNVRRSSVTYPYLLLMGEESSLNFDEIMKNGCNDYITKPIDPMALEKKLNNASNLLNSFRNLGDTREDFPSAGGVIAKSAFNQLCLAALERGGRYNELSFILTMTLENFDEIKSLDGLYNAEYSVSKMAHHMARIRRLSDILGQTGVNQYSILLQRTEQQQEAVDAAKRFTHNFEELEDFIPPQGHEARINISIMHLPTGELSFDHMIRKAA